jgi:hypothetical protein
MAVPALNLSLIQGIRKANNPLISTNPALVSGTRAEGAVKFFELAFENQLPANIGESNAQPGGGYLNFYGNQGATGINGGNIYYDTVDNDPLFPGTFPALPTAGNDSGPGTVLHPTQAASITLTESGV